MQGGGFAPSPGYGLTATSASAATEQSSQSPGVTNSQRQPLSASGDRSEMSHLDSLFASSGWTREDVMVVAAGVQLLMWVALLSLVVQR